MLEEGLTMLHLDARHPEVIVPEYLKDDLSLRINLSYRFGLTDLEITDRYVSATLSFNRQPFHCTIPLESIWGLSHPPSPELNLFLDDLPPELLTLILQNAVATQIERGDDPLERTEEAEKTTPPDAPPPNEKGQNLETKETDEGPQTSDVSSPSDGTETNRYDDGSTVFTDVSSPSAGEEKSRKPAVPELKKGDKRTARDENIRKKTVIKGGFKLLVNENAESSHPAEGSDTDRAALRSRLKVITNEKK